MINNEYIEVDPNHPRIILTPPLDFLSRETSWTGALLDDAGLVDVNNANTYLRRCVIKNRSFISFKFKPSWSSSPFPSESVQDFLKSLRENSFIANINIDEKGAAIDIRWVSDAVGDTEYPKIFIDGGSRASTHFFIRGILANKENCFQELTWGLRFRLALRIDFELIASYESISWGGSTKEAVQLWKCLRTGKYIIDKLSLTTIPRFPPTLNQP